MKFIALIFLVLIAQTNSKLTEKNPYDYSSYSAISIDEDLVNQELTSTAQDESVVYITNMNSIKNSIINKQSGDASNIENSEFYGVNAAVLVQDGMLNVNGGKIITNAKGANALVATNGGIVDIVGTNIISTGEASARGLHSTYGGIISAKEVNISSTGGSCATLATDRGEGTISCSNCDLSTQGAGSPLIYSTGIISVSNTKGNAFGAQAVVVEGKNVASVGLGSELKCTASPNRKTVDQCGIMIYQSMSGDASDGTSSFKCSDSTIEIVESSSYYQTAPMFFITNTDAKIEITNCNFKYGSDIFLSLKGTNEWGKVGVNGGNAVLNLTNQNIKGDFEVDDISTLTINMVKSHITGKINNANSSKQMNIVIDKDSTITLTGNSFCYSMKNGDPTGANLINGTYNWTIVHEEIIPDSDSNPDTGSARGILNSYSLLLSLSLILSIIL